MKRLFFITGLLGLALLGAEPRIYAANVNVSDAAGFQAALLAAQNNGEPDTINLQAGNYTSTFTYTAGTGENKPLTILGAGRDVVNLDGGGGGTILFIDTATNNTGADGNADILVQGINFQNSGADGITIRTDQADAAVQQNGFNMVDIGVNSLITSTGNLNTVSNIFDNNFFGASTSLNMGLYTLQDNQFSHQGQSAATLLSNNNANFLGNTINGNPASGSSAITLLVAGNVLLDSNTILNNSISGDGGAINGLVNGSVVMTDNIISGNSSTGGNAGGVFFAVAGSGPVTLTNNTFANNLAAAYGGGIGIQITALPIVTNIYNNIFFGNTAPAGQGADIAIDDGGDPNTGSPINLFNNDFNEFSTTCQDNPPCVPNISGVSPTDTNIHADPLFANAAGGDFNLLLGSPAIGAGDPNAPSLPTVDNIGIPLNNPPDMGALAALVSIVVDPTSLDFGTLAITQSNTQELTLSNNGVTTLKVSAVDLSDDANYSVDFNGGASPCGSAVFELNAGDNCTLEVTFLPENGGTFSATLTYSSNDPAIPNLVVPLTGIGVGANGCAMNAAPASSMGMGGFALLGLAALGLRLRRRPN